MAAWIESIQQQRGKDAVVSDPLLGTLHELMDANPKAQSLVLAIADKTPVLKDLAPAQLDSIAQALVQLRSKGVMATVQSTL